MSSRPQNCPVPVRLSQAFCEGPDDGLRAHLAECESCAHEWEAMGDLAQLARQLPSSLPDPSRAEEVRASLLAAAAKSVPPRQERRRSWALWATGAAALLIALVLGGRLLLPGVGPFGDRPPERHARVRVIGQGQGEGTARYEHTGTLKDEIVRLTEGTLLIEVSPLGPGERFRVVTGDGEVEVRGTLFDTTATHDHLERVRVLHGRVEVRPDRGGTVVLSGGDRWPASAAEPPGAPEPAPAGPMPPIPPLRLRVSGPASLSLRQPAAKTASEKVPRGLRGLLAHRGILAHRALPSRNVPATGADPARASPTPAELAFDQGWQALRAGHYLPAAHAFQRAADQSGGQPLGEDAWFWRAVALARAGRTREATEGLRRFLSRYPDSPRAGEASSILGWLMYDAGDLDEAERLFKAAARDRTSEVRDSARAGLQDIAARRGAPR